MSIAQMILSSRPVAAWLRLQANRTHIAQNEGVNADWALSCFVPYPVHLILAVRS